MRHNTKMKLVASRSRRKLPRVACWLAMAAMAVGDVAAHAAADGAAWPPITRECRPWAYWWWMGSAVDATNLSRELHRYHDAGLGGVHIIPIYGATGYEDRYIPYLSERWMEMLRYTVTEAGKLDLGVDMTTGSGWCFGGPTVGERDANALVKVKTFEVPAGARLTNKFDRELLQALEFYPVRSKPVDLLGRIGTSGELPWAADAPGTLYAIWQKPSGQKVKRPAPGGEGPMLNLIYPPAVTNFLKRFTTAFAGYDGPKPRAMYHDSYEYRLDWAPDFFAQFEKRRGYRLQDELPALFDRSEDEHAARVKCDYRETVSDVMAEESLPAWVNWSHQHGFITRNEAHGSPGNLLDLYAAADVPETEMFNKDRNRLVSKFASSAAHVAGHKLVAAETGTWLKEHFTETLADLKYLADDMFLSGVNHVFYHGTCYSPDEAGWPGWLFYASTEMNPRNSIWHDVGTLNGYIARCQAVLQDGAPANDLLVYWPIYDFWQGSGGGTLPHLTVHARGWLEGQPIGSAAARLWERGFSFDYISDRQIAATRAAGQGLVSGGNEYRAIVIRKCRLIPVATMAKLLELAQDGATVIFEDQLPEDVPGAAAMETRRAELKELRSRVSLTSSSHDAAEARVGKGRVIVGVLEPALGLAGIPRETLVDHAGLWQVCRKIPGGRAYFIANRGSAPVDGWTPLAAPMKSAVFLDPMTGRSGIATVSPGKPSRVYLQLQPGESIIMRTFETADATGESWPYTRSTGDPIPLSEPWDVTFVSGGPVLPPAVRVTNLVSWTEFGGTEAKAFAGTARYSTRFDAPPQMQRGAWLDFGRIAQSARVRLNGRDLGTLIVPPFRVAAGNLKRQDNLLEIEVTNVSANRIRDLDRRGVKWRNFHDINFVNMDYKPFNAANWPLHESGLLGPVTLQRLAAP